MASLTFVLVSLLYKTERFHVAEEDHRRRQSVVTTSMRHSAIALCATFLFLTYYILTPSVINH